MDGRSPECFDGNGHGRMPHGAGAAFGALLVGGVCGGARHLASRLPRHACMNGRWSRPYNAPRHTAQPGPSPKRLSSRRSARIARASLPKKSGDPAAPAPFFALPSHSRGVFAEGQTFTGLGISKRVEDALRERMGVSTPTRVQALTLPELLRARRDVLIGAETGSGKTLAFLLPVLEEYVQKAEAERRSDVQEDGRSFAEEDDETLRPPASADVAIRALVLVPTQELCAQVVRFVDSLSEDLSGARAFALGGDHFSVPRGTLVVAVTPRTFLDRAEIEDYGELRCIVVDEADMLMDGSFKRETEALLDRFRRPLSNRKRRQYMREGVSEPSSHPAEGQPQVVFAGATYPSWVGERSRGALRDIRRRYPDIVELRTSLLHRRTPMLTERWRDVSQSPDRFADIHRALRDGPEGQAMVFANTVQSAVEAHRYLNSLEELRGKVIAAHRDIKPALRIAALDDFRAGRAQVLVCTDVAARGIDLGPNVTHVVQYEFATNVVGYLHRIGRTARAGAAGTVTHFVDDGSRALADEISGKSHDKLENVFSRNRNLSNRMKKARQLQSEAGNPSREQSASGTFRPSEDEDDRTDGDDWTTEGERNER